MVMFLIDGAREQDIIVEDFSVFAKELLGLHKQIHQS
jgi:hypothetical protein